MSTSAQEQETIPLGFETIIQYNSSDKDKLKDSEIPLSEYRGFSDQRNTDRKGKMNRNKPNRPR
jgi:hypothetical protein